MRFPVLNWSVPPQLRESWCIYVSLTSIFPKTFQLPKRTLRFTVDEERSDYTVMETVFKSSIQ